MFSIWSLAFSSDMNQREQLGTGHRQRQTYSECTRRRWRAKFTQIILSHSGQRVSFTFFHCDSKGLTLSQYSRRCRPSVGASELGQRARSRFGGGIESPISTAGPRLRVTRWRRSIRTSPPTGGSRQSGIITSMESRVGPPKTSVPSTAKSSMAGNRRFVDKGSKATSTSVLAKALMRSRLPSVFF